MGDGFSWESNPQGLAHGGSLHKIDYHVSGSKTGIPKPEAPSSDLVALVHFVVNELQQEPRDVSQDEGGDEVPVDHVPQAANTPVEVQVRVSQVRLGLGMRASRVRMRLSGMRWHHSLSSPGGHSWASGIPHLCPLSPGPRMEETMSGRNREEEAGWR